LQNISGFGNFGGGSKNDDRGTIGGFGVTHFLWAMKKVFCSFALNYCSLANSVSVQACEKMNGRKLIFNWVESAIKKHALSNLRRKSAQKFIYICRIAIGSAQ